MNQFVLHDEFLAILFKAQVVFEWLWLGSFDKERSDRAVCDLDPLR